jgi:hypothetical protein
MCSLQEKGGAYKRSANCSMARSLTHTSWLYRREKKNRGPHSTTSQSRSLPKEKKSNTEIKAEHKNKGRAHLLQQCLQCCKTQTKGGVALLKLLPVQRTEKAAKVSRKQIR